MLCESCGIGVGFRVFIKGGLLGTEVMAARCSIMESILEFMVACVWEKAV